MSATAGGAGLDVEASGTGAEPRAEPTAPATPDIVLAAREKRAGQREAAEIEAHATLAAAEATARATEAAAQARAAAGKWVGCGLFGLGIFVGCGLWAISDMRGPITIVHGVVGLFRHKVEPRAAGKERRRR